MNVMQARVLSLWVYDASRGRRVQLQMHLSPAARVTRWMEELRWELAAAALEPLARVASSWFCHT